MSATVARAWPAQHHSRQTARATAAIVLLLHVTLGTLWWWQQRHTLVTRFAAPAVVTWMRLWPAVRQPLAVPRRVPEPREPAPRRTTPRPRLRAESRDTATAIHLPVPSDTAPAISALPASAPRPEPAPLNLALPARPASAPRSMIDQVLNDPRVHTIESASERFARNMGTDETEHVDAMADGRRVRKGKHCYIVRDSRAAQLDPFNGALSNAPKLVGNC